ncbi:MAG: DUF3793 family protein [Clostridium paraputrificum]
MTDKLNNFNKLLNNLNDKEYIEILIAYNVSLISARLKPSITLNLSKSNNKNTYELWNKYGEDYLESLRIKFIKLRESEKSLVILIYDFELLETFINIPKNKNFLMSLGYPNKFSVEEALETLQERYELYNCPHELGIFLGFPLDDVKDFMTCSDKKCLACGYWKVYNQCNKAKRIFNLFDRVKEETLDNILDGHRHCILFNNIKHKFESNQKLILN